MCQNAAHAKNDLETDNRMSCKKLSIARLLISVAIRRFSQFHYLVSLPVLIGQLGKANSVRTGAVFFIASSLNYDKFLVAISLSECLIVSVSG